jgi:hypothetical protein
LPRGHPWRSELGHGADGIRWFGPRVGRRGTGVEEGFPLGGASEAEAPRRAHDSLLARAVPAVPSHPHARGTGGSTDGGRRKGYRGMTGGPGLAVREERRKGPVVGWAAMMGRAVKNRVDTG